MSGKGPRDQGHAHPSLGTPGVHTPLAHRVSGTTTYTYILPSATAPSNGLSVAPPAHLQMPPHSGSPVQAAVTARGRRGDSFDSSCSTRNTSTMFGLLAGAALKYAPVPLPAAGAALGPAGAGAARINGEHSGGGDGATHASAVWTELGRSGVGTSGSPPQLAGGGDGFRLPAAPWACPPPQLTINPEHSDKPAFRLRLRAGSAEHPPKTSGGGSTPPTPPSHAAHTSATPGPVAGFSGYCSNPPERGHPLCSIPAHLAPAALAASLHGDGAGIADMRPMGAYDAASGLVGWGSGGVTNPPEVGAMACTWIRRTLLEHAGLASTSAGVQHLTSQQGTHIGIAAAWESWGGSGAASNSAAWRQLAVRVMHTLSTAPQLQLAAAARGNSGGQRQPQPQGALEGATAASVREHQAALASLPQVPHRVLVTRAAVPVQGPGRGAARTAGTHAAVPAWRDVLRLCLYAHTFGGCVPRRPFPANTAKGEHNLLHDSEQRLAHLGVEVVFRRARLSANGRVVAVGGDLVAAAAVAGVEQVRQQIAAAQQPHSYTPVQAVPIEDLQLAAAAAGLAMFSPKPCQDGTLQSMCFTVSPAVCRLHERYCPSGDRHATARPVGPCSLCVMVLNTSTLLDSVSSMTPPSVAARGGVLLFASAVEAALAADALIRGGIAQPHLRCVNSTIGVGTPPLTDQGGVSCPTCLCPPLLQSCCCSPLCFSGPGNRHERCCSPWAALALEMDGWGSAFVCDNPLRTAGLF